MTEPVIFYMGKIKKDRFWVQGPDGRFFQIDLHTKRVIEDLAYGKTMEDIVKERDVSEEEILLLCEMLGMNEETQFLLVEESLEKTHRIKRKGMAWGLVFAFVFSIFFLLSFCIKTPVTLVSSLRDQWMVAGLLTLSVIIHEGGHLLVMPRTKNIAMCVQWSGPIPLLSIIHNEAWKLSKGHRMGINIAGFVADFFVAGLVASMGFFFEQLSPWIWTFLIVHLFRMFFSIFPLLPGDGYWILVDLFHQPNLWTNGMAQLKQFKLNWLSCYAFARILFSVLFWFLYAYVLYSWVNLLLNQPFLDGILLFLHPAPLLLFLTCLYQLFAVISWGVMKGKEFLYKNDKTPGHH